MSKDLLDQIKEAAKASENGADDFVELLRLIDAHYDRMEQTITQSMATSTPIETIFDSVTEALLSVDPGGAIRVCNKVCAAYFGLTKDQLIGSQIEHLLPAAKGMPLTEFLAPYMADPDATHPVALGDDVEARRANGETFDAELNANRISTVDGHVFVISLRDVTGRRRAEESLRENEERYRVLVENAPEAIVVYDIDEGKLVDANENACVLFKMARKELLSVGPDAISPETQPDGTPSFGVRRGYLERALAGEHPTFEWMHQDAQGGLIPCEVRFSRMPAGEHRLVRVGITDISERKRNEAIAFAQNKILEMIASSMPNARTLRAICRFVERVDDSLKAAVMLYDEASHALGLIEGPALTASFKKSLDYVPIEQHGITCALAVHTSKDRICEDMAQAEAWQTHLDTAEDEGIGAAWSFLMRGAGGRIIGTLDVYCGEPRSPSTDELDKLSRMARLAGIAIKRQHDEERLRASEARYRELFVNTVDGVYIAGRDGELIEANPALVEMLGYADVEELRALGSTTRLYVNPIDRERVFARLEAEGIVKNFEYRLRRKDGSEIVVLENARALYDDAGNIIAHEGTITDITERKRAETRVFEEKERAQVTLQSIGDGVITTDSEGRVDYINPVAQDLTGWDMRGASGRHINEIMTVVNEDTRATIDNPVTRCLAEGRVISLGASSVLVKHDGDEIPIQDSAAPIRDRIGNIIGAVMVFHDTSKESRLFRQLSYQASHDALTGLVNRNEFENRIVAALSKLREDSESSHALLYLDLDQFKIVNDTFGHTAGDELLRQLSTHFQAFIRSSDVLSRLGGDEFGILLERCGEDRALEVAESLRSAVENFRFEWKESFTTVRCSVGVVVFNAGEQEVANLMSCADIACYAAKDSGRNQVHLYSESDGSIRIEEMKWVSRITSAVEQERFELYFQPIIGIGEAGRERRGHYEMLLRMRDIDGEIISPDLFIPAAERYNLMSTLDRWVVRTALRTLADRDAPDGEARYTIAINLSGTSLSEDRFLDFLIEELQHRALPAGAVCFEITETAAISNLSRVIHFMQELKKLGCLFSLDDFGSGLSSFTYLKNLPVDYLKIDGHFIRNVTTDEVDQTMVRAISDVGKAMGIETIAERVENRDVLDKLAEIGVEFAQGFYVARPASVDEFEPWQADSAKRLA